MDSTEVRRWIAGFEAATAADREAFRRRGPDPTWAIRLSLSMIDALWQARDSRAPGDPVREREAEVVRGRWALLRRRLAR